MIAVDALIVVDRLPERIAGFMGSSLSSIRQTTFMRWSRLLLIAKRNAFLIHLAISAAMFLPLTLIVLLRWFPMPLFVTDGGWQGLRIALVLDLILGPMLTFLIYNPSKTRLALAIDFGFIGITQTAALAFGTYNIAQKRIDVVAFDQGAFHAVAHSSFSNQNLDPEQWQSLGSRTPRWAFVLEPTAEQSMGVLAFNVMERRDRFELAFLYEPLTRHRADVRKAAMTEAELASQGGSIRLRFDRLVATAGKPLYAFPLQGSYRTAILVLDGDLKRIDTLYVPENK